MTRWELITSDEYITATNECIVTGKKKITDIRKELDTFYLNLRDELLNTGKPVQEAMYHQIVCTEHEYVDCEFSATGQPIIKYEACRNCGIRKGEEANKEQPKETAEQILHKVKLEEGTVITFNGNPFIRKDKVVEILEDFSKNAKSVEKYWREKISKEQPSGKVLWNDIIEKAYRKGVEDENFYREDLDIEESVKLIIEELSPLYQQKSEAGKVLQAEEREILEGLYESINAEKGLKVSNRLFDAITDAKDFLATHPNPVTDK